MNNLKTYYDNNPEDENLIYVTINQSNMDGALRSGSYRLQTVDTARMVSDLLVMFERYLQSDRSVQLDSSFTVFFKVLSFEHIQYPKHRRKFEPIGKRRKIQAVGCRETKFDLGTQGLLDVPGAIL